MVPQAAGPSKLDTTVPMPAAMGTLCRFIFGKLWMLVTDRDQEGFTLIELIIAIVIVPLVIGAASFAMIAVFDNQTSIQGRLSDSLDAQVTSTYFERDVQGATTITTSPSAGCPPATPGTYTQVLGLGWNEGSQAVTISYVTERLSTTSWTLIRELCLGSNTASASTLATGMTSAPTLVIDCEKEPSGQNPPGCPADDGQQPMYEISQIMLTIPDTKSSFPFSVSASPRLTAVPGQAGGTSPSELAGETPPVPQLILLSNGGSCPSLTLDSGAGLSVMNLQGGTGALAIDGIQSCSGGSYPISAGSSVAGTAYTEEDLPAQLSSCGPGCGPSPYYSPTGIADPYKSLSTPTTGAQAGSCNVVVNIETCSKGVYSSSGNNCPSFGTPTGQPQAQAITQMQFSPGVAVFEGCTLTVRHNDTLEGSNVLLYFTDQGSEDGSLQVRTGATVTLSPIAGGASDCPSGPPNYPPDAATYPCISVWQDSSDTTAVRWDSSPTTSIALYLPGAALSVDTLSNVCEAVAQSLTVGSNDTATIQTQNSTLCPS